MDKWKRRCTALRMPFNEGEWLNQIIHGIVRGAPVIIK